MQTAMILCFVIYLTLCVYTMIVSTLEESERVVDMPHESRKLMQEGENLLRICLILHMSNCGTSDPLTTLEYVNYCGILRVARDHWGYSNNVVDAAIRNLVICTIDESEHRHDGNDLSKLSEKLSV